jgi:hypothetical protein
MAIVPDNKDWTWVLERLCPECRFETSSIDFTRLPVVIGANAAQWDELLRGPGDLAARPTADKWSPLEYGCHVRDVFRLFDYRLSLMLTRDDPLFPNWDQDETAVAHGYSAQDPVRVAGELTEAAEVIASSFAAVKPAQLSRRGRRSDGAQFTVDTFGRYFIHDPIHHLWDVTGRHS